MATSKNVLRTLALVAFVVAGTTATWLAYTAVRADSAAVCVISAVLAFFNCCMALLFTPTIVSGD